MSAENIVRHCSPTLAGIKTGNMFIQFFRSEDERKEYIRQFNKCFCKKGLCMIPLRSREHKTLLYIFRPSFLYRDLQNSQAYEILEKRGYLLTEPNKCIRRLIERIKENDEFPHEVGLFLGYPPEDVFGFIENKKECKCVGCWKVYDDVESALKVFEKYKKCTASFCRQFANGKKLEQLIKN